MRQPDLAAWADEAVRRLPHDGEHAGLSPKEASAKAAAIHRAAWNLGETINAYAHLGRLVAILHASARG